MRTTNSDDFTKDFTEKVLKDINDEKAPFMIMNFNQPAAKQATKEKSSVLCKGLKLENIAIYCFIPLPLTPSQREGKHGCRP